MKKIADDNNFPSRQAAKPAIPLRRKQRRYRTGRDQHLGIKTTVETRERFYKAADERSVTAGRVAASGARCSGPGWELAIEIEDSS
jgi:hypothetical protein